MVWLTPRYAIDAAHQPYCSQSRLSSGKKPSSVLGRLDLVKTLSLLSIGEQANAPNSITPAAAKT